MDTLKKTLKTIGRRINRTRDNVTRSILLLTRKHLRQTYQKILQRNKYTAFRKLCTQSTPWGTPYKLAKYTPQKPLPLLTSASGRPCVTKADSIKLLLTEKFPASTQQLERDKHIGIPSPSPEITAEEVKDIIRVLLNHKAPGPDRLCTRAVKALNRHHPEVLPALFTSCLGLGYFPRQWREGRAVFLPKPGKDPSVTGSYRPLTMLSILGKVYERVVNRRIVDHYDTHQPLHQRQYGFRKGIGTEMAINQVCDLYRNETQRRRLTAAISLDIKGAFDHIEWNGILEQLAKANVPHYLVKTISSYLSDRTVHCEGQNTILERGCPQGSVLAPTLWNILYDVLINKVEQEYPNICVYADDTIVITSADTRQELETKVTDCITKVSDALNVSGLLLNVGKTEILLKNQLPLYQRGNSQEMLTINVLNHAIKTSKAIKYLGVMIDNKLLFKVHFEYMEEKMMTRIPLLQKLARNLYGYSFKARKTMFQGLIFSIAKYCSSIWYHRLQLKTYRQHFIRVQRRCDIISSRSYKDVSSQVASVLAASPPLHLQVIERSVKWLLSKSMPVPHWGHLPQVETDDEGGLMLQGEPASLAEVAKAFKKATTEEWNNDWESITPKKWPQQLFPSVYDRLRIKDPPTFWSSQAISDHGCFKAYLKRVKSDAPENYELCPACGFGYPETAEHVLTECMRFMVGRPMDWDRLEEHHIPYMQEVMLKLWKTENPHFRIINSSIHVRPQ